MPKITESWLAYNVELGLRQGKSWEGQLPANLETLVGWMKSDSHWKRVHEKLLAENPETGDELYELLIQEKARGILQELTIGDAHEGESSQIPYDLRFKRTHGKPGQGNLYIGAGNIIVAIAEARRSLEGGNVVTGRNRLYISPGKVVVYRYSRTGSRDPITRADGRVERFTPPGRPEARLGWRSKPSSITFAERIDYPAFLHFTLWFNEFDPLELRKWLEAAGEQGLFGFHSGRQGQFNVMRFYPTPQEARRAQFLKITSRP